MSDLLQATDPESCGYEVTVIWPDGTRTKYEGVRLTANDVAAALGELSAEIAGRLQLEEESETT